MFTNIINKICLLIIIGVINIEIEAKLQQKFLVEVFRHGAREKILSLSDDDPYQQEGGELTSVGMRQHYLLGKLLRNKYIIEKQFLNQSFDHNQIKIFASEANRSIQSAYSHYYGLYPLGSGPSMIQIDKQLTLPPYQNLQAQPEFDDLKAALPNYYQPVPVHILHDEKFIFQYECPNRKQLLESYPPEHQKIYDYVWSKYGQQLAQDLSIIFNVKVETMKDIKSISSDLDCDIYKNNPIHPSLTTQQIEQLKFFHNFYWVWSKGSYNYAKIVSTNLVKDIINFLDQKIKNDSLPLKWVSYSGHDNNIISLYYAFNLTNLQCIVDKFEQKNISIYKNCEGKVNFAANILIELFQDDAVENGKYYVQIASNGVYMNLCDSQNITCEYNEFKQRVQQNFVQDPQKECGVSQNNDQNNQENTQTQKIKIVKKNVSNPSNTGLFVFSIVEALIIIIILVILFKRFNFQKQEQKQEKPQMNVELQMK